MATMYKNCDVSNGSKDITIGYDPANPSLGMTTRPFNGVSKNWGDMAVDSRKRCVDKVVEIKGAAEKKEKARLRTQRWRAGKKAKAATVETALIPVTPPPIRRKVGAATAPANRRARLGGQKLVHLDEHRALEAQVGNNLTNFDKLAEFTMLSAARTSQNLERQSQNMEAFQEQQLALNEKFGRYGEAIQQTDGRVSTLEEAGGLQQDFNWHTSGRLAELERVTGLTPPRPRR